jgi:hypothetical protein
MIEDMRTLWNRGVVYSKRLRGSYGSSLIVLLFAQVALVGGIFVAYAWAGLHWDVPTTMKAWLGVSALEACGIALITKHQLFPH